MHQSLRKWNYEYQKKKQRLRNEFQLCALEEQKLDVESSHSEGDMKLNGNAAVLSQCGSTQDIP
jgi:hypothetical protein